MSKYSKEDILRMVDEEVVGFIRLQFTDVFGTVKNIAVTAGQLEQALNNECSFDGSGIDGFVRIEEDDMYLYPDLDSFEIFPWRPQTGKVARLICDIHKCDGTPFEGDSRYILKRVIREAAKMGIYPYIAPECEFCLFPYDTDGEVMLHTQGHGLILMLHRLIQVRMSEEILFLHLRIWELMSEVPIMSIHLISMRLICSQ